MTVNDERKIPARDGFDEEGMETHGEVSRILLGTQWNKLYDVNSIWTHPSSLWSDHCIVVYS